MADEHNELEPTTEAEVPAHAPRRRRIRRSLLWTGAVLIGAAVVLAAVVAGFYFTAGASNVGKLDFANTLRIPPLLAPHVDGHGRKVFDLTLETGTSTLLPGKTTRTWGVNGAYLGPTLRAARGDRILIHVHNHLPQMTTIHWHGMHLPAVDDGGPHQMLAPGATWSPSWTIDQPAATLWYHPHPHGATADQVYQGIAGFFLLDDARSRSLPLPHRYGIDDIPLVVQDKRLNSNGSLDFGGGDGFFHPIGRLGGTILVNGTYNPHIVIHDERVRFRLLNGSNGRIYDIGFADGRTFDLIATDEGLLDHPVPLTRVQLSPGERAEIVARFHPGEHVVLRSFPPHLGTNFLISRFVGGDDSFDLLQVRAARTLRPSPSIPARLADGPPLDPGKAVRTRHFELQRTDEINGKHMDMNRIDFAVIAGSSEIWVVRNGDLLPHNFHIHGATFHVLKYANGPTPPALTGPKDTVYVPPGKTDRLLVQFGDYADPHHPYMFHCHILRHEDNGMMGQYVTIRRGQESKVGLVAYHPGTAGQLGPAISTATIRQSGYELALHVDPNAAFRRSTFTLALTRAGKPVAGADVRLRFRMLDMLMTRQQYPLTETRGGRYVLRRPAFQMAGNWRLSLSVTPRHKGRLNVTLYDRVPSG